MGSIGRPIGLFPLLCLFCLFAIVLTISVCLSPAIRCDRCRELRPATDFPVAPRGNRYRTCLRCRVHPRLSSLSCWLLTGRRRAAAPLLYNQLIQMLLYRPVLAVCGHLRSVTGPTTPVRVDHVRRSTRRGRRRHSVRGRLHRRGRGRSENRRYSGRGPTTRLTVLKRLSYSYGSRSLIA